MADKCVVDAVRELVETRGRFEGYVESIFVRRTVAEALERHFGAAPDHRAIDDCLAELRCDGIIEAIRWSGNEFISAIQWHPEFQKKSDHQLLNPEPLMQEFLTHAKNRKSNA